jgi:hypothetical protein
MGKLGLEAALERLPGAAPEPDRSFGVASCRTRADRRSTDQFRIGGTRATGGRATCKFVVDTVKHAHRSLVPHPRAARDSTASSFSMGG